MRVLTLLRSLSWILCVGLVSLTCPRFASADWEASLTATSSKGEFEKVSGKFYAQKDRFRLDSAVPFELSAYLQSGARQAIIAVPSFRIRLSSNLGKFSGEIPSCFAKEFSACVSELKLKKIASEKCGEKTCDVYEGSGVHKSMKKVKLWHWSGEKEPIFSKVILTKKTGALITVLFTNISRKSRETSFYIVPENFKDAGSFEDFYGDLKGKSE